MGYSEMILPKRPSNTPHLYCGRCGAKLEWEEKPAYTPYNRATGEAQTELVGRCPRFDPDNEYASNDHDINVGQYMSW